jgi:hypothetical protein
MDLRTAFVYYVPFSIYLAWLAFATIANAAMLILIEQSNVTTPDEEDAEDQKGLFNILIV